MKDEHQDVLRSYDSNLLLMFISTFATIVFLGCGALLGARLIFKTVRNNWESIGKFISNTYNLPETTFQKVKVSVIMNKFNWSLQCKNTMLHFEKKFESSANLYSISI